LLGATRSLPAAEKRLSVLRLCVVALTVALPVSAQSGDSPLHQAAFEGHLQCVRMLGRRTRRQRSKRPCASSRHFALACALAQHASKAFSLAASTAVSSIAGMR
jgi:hypothetical protein